MTAPLGDLSLELRFDPGQVRLQLILESQTQGSNDRGRIRPACRLASRWRPRRLDAAVGGEGAADGALGGGVSAASGGPGAWGSGESCCRSRWTASVPMRSEWRWQFVCPAGRVCRDPRFGPPSRYHLHESVQKAVAGAGRCAGVTKRISPHVMRHSVGTICSRMGTTFGQRRSCWVIGMSARRSSSSRSAAWRVWG